MEASRWLLLVAVVVVVVIVIGLAWVFFRPQRGPTEIPGPPPEIKAPGIMGGPGGQLPPSAPKGQ